MTIELSELQNERIDADRFDAYATPIGVKLTHRVQTDHGTITIESDPTADGRELKIKIVGRFVDDQFSSMSWEEFSALYTYVRYARHAIDDIIDRFERLAQEHRIDGYREAEGVMMDAVVIEEELHEANPAERQE